MNTIVLAHYYTTPEVQALADRVGDSLDLSRFAAEQKADRIVFAGVPEYEGINFAIPFQWVKKTIPELYRGGEVKRCWIGSGLYEADKNSMKFYYILYKKRICGCYW